MAARFSVHWVLELIDKYLDEEDLLESDDDEIDRQHVNCDFLDEKGEEVVLPCVSTNQTVLDNFFPCERDSLLLHDIERFDGKF